jgi:hypothetical protein
MLVVMEPCQGFSYMCVSTNVYKYYELNNNVFANICENAIA